MARSFGPPTVRPYSTIRLKSMPPLLASANRAPVTAWTSGADLPEPSTHWPQT